VTEQEGGLGLRWAGARLDLEAALREEAALGWRAQERLVRHSAAGLGSPPSVPKHAASQQSVNAGRRGLPIPQVGIPVLDTPGYGLLPPSPRPR
jgi:hypothetical protein